MEFNTPKCVFGKGGGSLPSHVAHKKLEGVWAFTLQLELSCYVYGLCLDTVLFIAGIAVLHQGLLKLLDQESVLVHKHRV